MGWHFGNMDVSGYEDDGIGVLNGSPVAVREIFISNRDGVRSAWFEVLIDVGEVEAYVERVGGLETFDVLGLRWLVFVAKLHSEGVVELQATGAPTPIQGGE